MSAYLPMPGMPQQAMPGMMPQVPAMSMPSQPMPMMQQFPGMSAMFNGASHDHVRFGTGAASTPAGPAWNGPTAAQPVYRRGRWVWPATALAATALAITGWAAACMPSGSPNNTAAAPSASASTSHDPDDVIVDEDNVDKDPDADEEICLSEGDKAIPIPCETDEPPPPTIPPPTTPPPTTPPPTTPPPVDNCGCPDNTVYISLGDVALDSGQERDIHIGDMIFHYSPNDGNNDAAGVLAFWIRNMENQHGGTYVIDIEALEDIVGSGQVTRAELLAHDDEIRDLIKPWNP